MDSKLQAGYEECRRIMQAHGKSYYFATSFFPRKQRQAIYALYALVRQPDDIVDNPQGKTPQQLRQELDEWIIRFYNSLQNPTGVTVPLYAAITTTYREYEFPLEWAQSFFRSMHSDVNVHTYQTYQDLEQYMYGSAGVVGYFMAALIGLRDEQSLEYAKRLGYACQLTNFLRDIQMDYKELGRIYIPLEDMKRFGLSEVDIAQEQFTSQFRELMLFEVRRAENLYREVDAYLRSLHKKRGKTPFLIASNLYRAIHGELAKQDYNPFLGRASTSYSKKLFLTARTVLTSR